MDDLPDNLATIRFSPDGKTVAWVMENRFATRDLEPQEGEIRSAGFRWNATGAVAVLSGYSSGGFAFDNLLSGRLFHQISSDLNFEFAMSADGRLFAPISGSTSHHPLTSQKKVEASRPRLFC